MLLAREMSHIQNLKYLFLPRASGGATLKQATVSQEPLAFCIPCYGAGFVMGVLLGILPDRELVAWDACLYPTRM